MRGKNIDLLWEILTKDPEFLACNSKVIEQGPDQIDLQRPIIEGLIFLGFVIFGLLKLVGLRRRLRTSPNVFRVNTRPGALRRR